MTQGKIEFASIINGLNKEKLLLALQGEAIKTAGIIEVEVKIEDKEPIEVKVSGNSVIAFKSELVLKD